jgi:hypothetical protein
MGYANQDQLQGLEIFSGEVPELIFVEADRKAAYRDIENGSFNSLDRLYLLAEVGNSHQAHRLIGMVTLGKETSLTPVRTDSGQLINYDDFWKYLVEAEHEGETDKAEAIARMMGLPQGSMNGDGR